MLVGQRKAADPVPRRRPYLSRWKADWRCLVCWGLVVVGWSWTQGWTQNQAVGSLEPKDTPSELAERLKAANQGDREAQLKLGKIYYQGQAGRQKEKQAEAVRWFRAASEQGSVEASAWLGACYLLGRGIAQDEQKARTLLEVAANQEDAVGLRFLGVLHERRHDYSQAAGFYAQAVQRGDNNSLIRLAHLYAHGLGTAKDKKKADSLLIQAAMGGGEWAQLRLGRIYESGDRKAGIAKNPALAVQLYAAAAGQGNRIAAYRLGLSYNTGLGTALAPDAKKAFACFKQAALQGYAPAQYELAQMREKGQGVTQSLGAAYYWYSLAQRRGHAQAAERLLDLRSRMNAEQIRRAEDLLQQHDQAERNGSLKRP